MGVNVEPWCLDASLWIKGWAASQPVELDFGCFGA